MNTNSPAARLWVTGGGGGWRGVPWEGAHGSLWAPDAASLGCGWRVPLWVVATQRFHQHIQLHLRVWHPFGGGIWTRSEVLWDPPLHPPPRGLQWAQSSMAGRFGLFFNTSLYRGQSSSPASPSIPRHARSEAGGVGGNGSVFPLTKSHSFVSHFRVIIEPPVVRVF